MTWRHLGGGTRWFLLSAVMLGLALPAVSAADEFVPYDDDEEIDDDAPPPPVAVPPPAPRAPEPARAEPAPTRSAPAAAATTEPAAADFDDRRPGDSWNLGIGAGWTLGNTSLLEPNTASVRIAFARTVIIEPFAALGTGRSIDYNFLDDPRFDDPTEVEIGSQDTGFGLGVNAHLPVMSRRNLDLLVIGGFGYSQARARPVAFDHVEDEDLVDGEYLSFAVQTAVNWGLGIEWFLGRNLAITADALNPLVQWTRQGEYALDEVTVIDGEGNQSTEWREQLVTRTNTSYALIFDPMVRVMLHLYF